MKKGKNSKVNKVFKIKDDLTNNPSVIANAFNDYYASMAATLRDELPDNNIYF